MTETNETQRSGENSILENPENQENPFGESEQRKFDLECAEFQSRMAERIGAGEDLQTYAHMMACQRCQGLIRELEYMAQAIRDSLSTPIEVDPRDDVWNNIVSKLGLDKDGISQMTLEPGEA